MNEAAGVLRTVCEPLLGEGELGQLALAGPVAWGHCTPARVRACQPARVYGRSARSSLGWCGGEGECNQASRATLESLCDHGPPEGFPSPGATGPMC
eukprot:scaffold3020_cov342-Prasinococcus_capsulatus_cf.AAC.7